MTEFRDLPPTESHWFDLSRRWRRRILLPPNPPQWTHQFEIEFELNRARGLTGIEAADGAARPFAVRALARHADGSLARALITLPAGPLTEREFPRWVDVYYGVEPEDGGEGSEAASAPLVAWDAEARRVTTPWYEIEFDAAGAIREFRFRQMDHCLAAPELGASLALAARQEGAWREIAPATARPDVLRATDAALTLEFRHAAPELELTRLFTFFATHFEIEARGRAKAALEFLSPLWVRHGRSLGLVIGPDGRRAPGTVSGRIGRDFDPAAGRNGYVFSSQTGYFLWAAGKTPADFLYEPETETRGAGAGLGWAALKPGARFSGRLRLAIAPFAGDFGLERLEAVAALAARPSRAPVRAGSEELLPAQDRPRAEREPGGAAVLRAGELQLRCEPESGENGAAEWRLALVTPQGRRALEIERLWGIEDAAGHCVWTRPAALALLPGARLRLSGEAAGPGGERWSVESVFIPRRLQGVTLFEERRAHTLLGERTAEARWRCEARTPIGPPLWNEGEATVFVPGNFARENFCPGQPHGGGPKWGPTERPERCPACKPGVAPGHADSWMFAASRLPNTWVAAADRELGLLALAGARPRSDLGESSLGFYAPACGGATLRLATPITYEPQVPHGYGGFDPAPRRDTGRVLPSQTALWTLYYTARDTENLNGWLECDAALYGLHAFFRPAAWKMPRERALRLTLGSLFRNFYRPEDHILTYSTGPDGQGAPVGFTGMSHAALALLEGGARLGETRWREAGLDVMDQVARAFLEGPDFPFVAWSPGKGWQTGGGEPGYLIFCALDNLLEAIALERARGAARPVWERAARRCLDAWVRAQREDGAFPLKHPHMDAALFPQPDYEATNVTAGVIACLATGWRLFGEAQWLESARRAAEFYGGLLDEGKLWGGPGDIEALVNSEVPMFYLRAFLRLAEITGDARHLAWARDAAAWRLAFQYGHCWALTPGAQLYFQGWAGLGSEGASASNLHSVCFGAVNLPDYALAARLLGGDFWPARMRDLAGYATQQFGRFDGDALGVLMEGQGTESYWTSDTRWGKGNVLILTEKPNLGYMSWTTAWSAYGLLHAMALGLEEGVARSPRPARRRKRSA